MNDVEVYKFGGTSLADAARIQHAAGLVANCPSPVVVVVSAMGGITDRLVAAAAAAGRGHLDESLLHDIRMRHDAAAAALGLEPDDPDGREFERLFVELHDLLGAATAIGGLTPRSRDRIGATGEKLSARLMARAVAGAGTTRPPVVVDADTFLETDDCFGAATPLFGVVDRSIERSLRPHLDAGRTPIVTGFCGRARCGSTTTLGRGGSDYSATLMADALEATRVTIWTDVDGVFSADPGAVADARVIRQLNYREAGELAFYGAKVLHPRTIQPLIDRGIPAHIRSTFEPDAPGSLIDATNTPGSHPVKAVSAVPGQAIINVEGTGMAGVPGIAARIFSTLADAGVNVTMISQSSAESSVCVAVPVERAAAAEVALRRSFRLDLAHADIEDIRVHTDVALVAIVGLGMNHTPGVAGRLFGAVSRAGVNIVAIAQGASELNISFAVDGSDCGRALRAVHHEFGLHRIDPGRDNTDHFDLVLFGWGRIGRALASLVSDRADDIRARFGATPRVVALADRSGYLFRPNGISAGELRAAAEAKTAGHPVATLDDAVASTEPCDMLRHALGYRLARPVLVDASDADTRTLYEEAYAHGADVVTANKRPLSGPIDQYNALLAAADRAGGILRREATVGAGLPVVDTVEQMLATGDRIERIEGCLSGTLTYVLSELERGRRFRDVIEEAERLGYVEPNPVIDLAGEDVLRKAIILSRVAGFDVDDARVRCTGLVDRGLLGRDREAFIERLPEFDESLAEQVREAAAAGRVIRYVASLADGAIEVGPRAVEVDSPLGRLGGTDNMILFRSERYADNPLVVSGPGAGVEVTAMGVLTDILRIVAERT